MRLVVTGYRDWKVARTVFEIMEEWLPHGQPHLVGIGDCETGVDAMAHWWCSWHPNIVTWTFRAQWDRFGKKAGPIRNQEMLRVVQPELVLAFLHPHSKGARGCAEYAEKKGYWVLPVWEGR